ncbi:MAG TPA: sulfatase [Terriglobales bacterium]|nr:sulfatase [Terriglobales bacterium]
MTLSAEKSSEVMSRAETGQLLLLAAWFGLAAGLVEGAGLLWFQRVNWANWGRIAHVSLPIIWIAPLWDLLLFALAGLGIALLALVVPRLPARRFAIFLFVAMTAYDWLALVGRLMHWSCLILSLGLATVVVRAFGKHRTWFLRFWKTTLPWLAAVWALACVGIAGSTRFAENAALSKLPPAQAGTPNVVVIVVDTLRADHLSCYGYERPTSPQTDAIATQGVLFENAISPSSWTLPSHASLLTGRYSYEHGADDVKPPSGRALDERYPTLAEAFSGHGYRTGAFSANFIYFSRDLGLGRGFLHFEDYFHSAFDSFSRTLYGREFSRLFVPTGKVRRFMVRLGFRGIDELQPNSAQSWFVRKRASEVNRETLNWIDRDSTRPVFAFLNYFDTHRPYGTPPGYPRKFVQLDAHALFLQEISTSSPDKTAIAYDESVGYVDDQIGALLNALKQRGLDGRTLLIVTSDHGDLLGEHGLYGHKNTLYRPLIRVPLIFWQPGRVPAGVRVQRPVSNVLLAATLADLLGWKDAGAFPGPSLRAWWNSTPPPSSWPDPLSEISQFKDEWPTFPSRYGAMTSLITPQYHFMTHEKYGTELYDWTRDPAESVDLAKTPPGQALAHSLASEVRSIKAHPR